MAGVTTQKITNKNMIESPDRQKMITTIVVSIPVPLVSSSFWRLEAGSFRLCRENSVVVYKKLAIWDNDDGSVGNYA